MANPEHLQLLQQGVEEWHAWCDPHKDASPDLSGVDLAGANFTGAGLADTPLTTANFSHANLSHAHVSFAALHVSDLPPTTLTHTSLNDERREERANTPEDQHQQHPCAQGFAPALRLMIRMRHSGGDTMPELSTPTSQRWALSRAAAAPGRRLP